MKILTLLANGFEETEFVTPFDIWQRGGCEVITASINDTLDVIGAHDLQVKAINLLNKIDITTFDALFLPGGGLGVKNLSNSLKVEKTIQEMFNANKWILAICAAPLVLSKSGILKNKKSTCFPGCESNLICKEFSEERVVIDGNVITSRAAGTAEEFALKSLSYLTNNENAKIIQNQIVAR